MITLQDLVIKCDNCNGITEWAECDKHEEADFSCYQITCLNCRWSQVDCDTTEHCKVIVEEVK